MRNFLELYVRLSALVVLLMILRVVILEECSAFCTVMNPVPFPRYLDSCDHFGVLRLLRAHIFWKDFYLLMFPLDLRDDISVSKICASSGGVGRLEYVLHVEV
ncbi:hypothetical protein RvY_05891 [Ramazzottius varieornatus]|uniref:Secreted protein n=1 Tax=Ramazzottius varieornatus TaxID=947166 RepID=A0A1D1V371_RAMVA|nr:hypothetical protein RvY_05891 [Ramazzottius varieornatus]